MAAWLAETVTFGLFLSGTVAVLAAATAVIGRLLPGGDGPPGDGRPDDAPPPELAAVAVAPFRIELVPASPSWADARRVHEVSEAFARLGFTRVGDFAVLPERVTLRGLIDRRGRFLATICENPTAPPATRFYYDVLAAGAGADGRVWTATSLSASALAVSVGAGRTCVTRPEARPEELVDTLARAVGDADLRTFAADTFCDAIERDHADQVDRLLVALGTDGELSAETLWGLAVDHAAGRLLAANRAAWAEAAGSHRYYAGHFLRLLGRLDPSPLSRAEAAVAEHRVVFVHDRLGPVGLATAVGAALAADRAAAAGPGGTTHVVGLAARCAAALERSTPREAFGGLTSRADGTPAVSRLVTLRDPFPADAYWTGRRV